MFITLDLWTYLLFFVLAGTIITGWLFFYFAKKHYINTRVILPRTLTWVFLEIQMPKATDDKDSGPKSTEEKKAIIAVAEQLFTTISQIETTSKNWFYKKDYISFEIACTGKKISFYINCPKHLEDVIEKQIHAQYPTAYIEEIKGYNPFLKGGKVQAVELMYKKKYYYPVRTYKLMETEPLNALTNAMSKLTDDEGVAIQYILYPAGSDWQKDPRKFALEIQQGKTPEAIEGKSFISKFIKDLRGDQKKKDEKDLYGEDKRVSLTPQQQEMVKRFEEKASRPGYYVNIRMLASSNTDAGAKTILQSLHAAFLQYNMPPFNSFQNWKRKQKDIIKDFIFRAYREQPQKTLLNTEEIASLWHPPTTFLETPNIKWLVSKKAAPPINIPREGLFLGYNTYRGVTTEIRMGEEDRLRHMYILGRSGTGKSAFMASLALQDIQNGNGICIIDPHGELVEDLLPLVPKERAEDVILFEPFDVERPMGLNMLETESEEQQDMAVQEMISMFYKLVTDPTFLGPMFEHHMRNAMLTLMADKDSPGTLAEIPRIFTDTEFQKYKAAKLTDPVVRNFWEKEMAKVPDSAKGEMLGYLISKVGRFVENSMMRNIIGQDKSAFNFREIMDTKKIFFVNLSKGRTGEINSKLLGLVIVSKLLQAALSRSGTRGLPPFFLYVDEFQNFVTDSFGVILSEARKYGLGLVIAHQFLTQLTQGAGSQGAGANGLREAVFGNAGTMISFRIGVEDAEVMAKEFAPMFNQFDLVNVEGLNAFVKLLIQNTASKPFNMKIKFIPRPTPEQHKIAEAIRQLSRLKYGRAREEVEGEILEKSKLGS